MEIENVNFSDSTLTSVFDFGKNIVFELEHVWLGGDCFGAAEIEFVEVNSILLENKSVNCIQMLSEDAEVLALAREDNYYSILLQWNLMPIDVLVVEYQIRCKDTVCRVRGERENHS